MITFLDENDVEYGALATIKATNAVNGERSLTGTIVSGDYVLSKIERGWRLRFDDEYYVVTYAKPVDEGKNVQVSFDAVHQFFWDFGKSSVYDQLSDGSHTFRAYLDFIFNGSGYKYDIETSLTVKAFEKQSFGYKNRLSLFNDVITSSGVEFQVNGKVVRILAKVGTDLSTIVRKNFNLNELGIEKNIGDFVTYQKGFGAYFDEEDHSKGRLIAEYTSPLASVYGKLEADPLVDERYKQQESLLSALKETVDNSYTISVSLDMEDLTRAGYRYTQPVAGDYIMAINETLGFKEKIRIVSFTSEYDVAGQLIKHTVTCNDIGSVKKLSASYTQTQHQAANAEVNANTAYEFANKALVSANGKNTNYYGDTFPVDNPKGTLKKGDLLFLTVGDTVKQYYWNGADWVINPVLDDVEAFKEQIAEELKDVPNREEFENKIAEEVATSKAEITTQIESAKTQAESNAKEYADTINQETAKVAEQANTAADEIKADLVNVKNNLTSTSLVANNAQAAVDAAKQELAEVNSKVDSAKEELTQAKQDLTEVASELNTAKQDLADSVTAVNTKVDGAKAELTQAKQELTNVANDLSKAKTDLQNAVSAVDTKATNLKSDLSKTKQDLASQAQQLQAQANAQTELSKRVTTVETTANGTRTTVSELSKTVAQNGKDITSVTARTKVVEDDLLNTKTTLSQVQTTANSTSQQTATLESGLNGLSAKFDNLKIGAVNLLHNSKGPFQPNKKDPFKYDNWITYPKTTIYLENGSQYIATAKTDGVFSNNHVNVESDNIVLWMTKPNGTVNKIISDAKTGEEGTVFVWDYPTGEYCLRVNAYHNYPDKSAWDIQIEKGNVATDYSPNEADLEQKVAEYKQTADQNYASLQTTVQNLDGTVQHNKTVADQTAQGFTTRIESLETYKDGESERANAYFESAKTETAKQLTAERTAIANNYVAKSTYTSDVTGIRNDLSATTTTANTTKTNLANYQASNDRAVASLQSNLQTANGNISSLKTKVEAVPGQITSAVSAVESKIPTEIGARNYIRDYGLTATGWSSYNSGWKFEIISDSTAKSGQYLKATCTTASTSSFNGFYKNLFDFSDGRFFGKQMTWSMDVKTSKNTKLIIGCEWGIAQDNVNTTENWQRFSKTFKVATSSSHKAWIFYSSNWNVGDIVYIRDVQLEDGSIATSPVPAIEDTESDITKLSSEIKQTADGMTLLATKTELNTAKNELQSGINTATNKANSAQSTANNNAQTISTHTTQISALNTGLQAKVSQTEFNTLSGRVTTAENNITAKANELSSKITTVEGKIPTEIGGVNLLRNSKGPFKPNTGVVDNHVYYDSSTVYLEKNQSYVISGLTDGEFSDTHEANQESNRIVLWLTDRSKGINKIVSDSNTGSKGTRFTWANDTGTYRLRVNTYKKVADKSAWNIQVEKGNVKSDYAQSPLDTDADITKVSSEIKQTADGMTLLATKTELSTAKTELQSGVSTATNKANAAQSTADSAVTKANAAQSTANNNAQTISTHTTQISALNTGLSAKVSQTDFNTLSGRVTTAENNIIAKANELSSKITTVESKIPTSVGGRNLLSKTNQGKLNWSWSVSSGGTTAEDYNADGVKAVKLTRTSDASFTWDYIVYEGLIRKLIEPNTKYTLSFDVKPNVDVTFSAILQRGDGGAPLTNAVKMNKALANKWTKVSCVLTSATTLPDGLSQVVYLSGMPVARGNYLIIKNIKLEKGAVPSDWSPAPEDAISQINSVSSEFKQTTDAIKASVSSLDSSTVKSSSLTINADGIVMKAGKSTSDVANAIGSYFSVNQNAINLFSDKINVKGSMIVSGAITSDKIASKQINTSHLNGKIITADVISSNAVTADAIKAGAVTTDKMSANSINGDRITAGTLDAAKIKAGSITASQIASGTITSNQIKAGGISSANIAAGAITGDKIAAGAIDANKIAANAITANMIRGGQLNSTNGATVFDLNAGTLTFNNDSGYIQRVVKDKIFAIQTWLGADSNSRDWLASSFGIRKSDNSRRSGIQFQLYNDAEDKPTAFANIWADSFHLGSSKGGFLFIVDSKNSVKPNWGDIPIAHINGGLLVKDIAIGGHSKSLLNIVEELCKKANIPWV